MAELRAEAELVGLPADRPLNLKASLANIDERDEKHKHETGDGVPLRNSGI